MNDSPKHSVSVAGIVVDTDERVLAIKRRDNGRWEMPGGVLELGEGIEAGVRREVLEETGITVEVERLTGVYKNLPRAIVAMVFRCHPGPETAHPTDEAAEVRWMTRNEVEHEMAPAFAIRVLDALTLPTAPPIRSHDGVHLLTSA